MAHLVVKTAQYLFPPIQLCDLCAQAVENRGKFTGDVTTAHHQQPFGESWQVKHLIRGENVFAPRHVRHAGVAASGDQDVVGGMALAIGHFHRVRIDQFCSLQDNRHPSTSQ